MSFGFTSADEQALTDHKGFYFILDRIHGRDINMPTTDVLAIEEVDGGGWRLTPHETQQANGYENKSFHKAGKIPTLNEKSPPFNKSKSEI